MKRKRVERFTREQFERLALPINATTRQPLWFCIGLENDEYVYLIDLPSNAVAIEVRSSIRENGWSASCGNDSIRCWLVDATERTPMGSKLSRWITRMPGWAGRTQLAIRQLWQIGQKMVPCINCNGLEEDCRLRCYKVRKEGPNQGQLFLRCPIRGCRYFE